MNHYIPKKLQKIDETFHKLLNNSKNLKNFIKNFEKFDEFD